MALTDAELRTTLTETPTVPRTPLTAWLMKRKSSSSKNRFLKSANKRFFTLDFESQIFYYSHNESSTQISMPILFRQLLGVESLASQSGMQSEQNCQQEPSVRGYRASSTNRTSAGFQSMPFSSQALFRTIPSFLPFPKRDTEQHGLVIKLHGKSMELVCNSKEEADMWIGGIREAMAIAHSTRKQIVSTDPSSLGEPCSASNSERSTTPPSSRTTTPRSSGNSTDDSDMAMAPGGKQNEFPPLAPGTPPLERGQKIAPLGFAGDIVRGSLGPQTMPLAPGDIERLPLALRMPGAALRATAACA